MKIRAASISTFARPGSLTVREWESLGRFAVRVEEEVGKHADDSRIGWTLDRIFQRYLYDEIERRLLDEGLNPKDWFLHLEPDLVPQAPMPATVKNWILHMRLREESSAAKRMAANTTSTGESTFKPTLAEQFEKPVVVEVAEVPVEPDHGPRMAWQCSKCGAANISGVFAPCGKCGD